MPLGGTRAIQGHRAPSLGDMQDWCKLRARCHFATLLTSAYMVPAAMKYEVTLNVRLTVGSST